MRMDAGIGDFIIEGQPLASLAGGDPVSDSDAAALAQNYSFDRQRTLEQDAAFGLQQMVDIASKALSPGLNDASTAILCIDRITQVLVRLAARRIETRFRGVDGELRVIARGPTFESLLELAYVAVRSEARGNAVVLMRLVWSLERVASVTTDLARRRALAEHLRRVEDSASKSADASLEQAAVVSRARALREQLLTLAAPRALP